MITTMRIDDALKRESDAIFSNLGLNMSSAITIFLKQVVRTKGIPFELKCGATELPVSREQVREAVRAMRAANGRDWNEEEVNSEIAAARRSRRGRTAAI